jgi:hypothetical protein
VYARFQFVSFSSEEPNWKTTLLVSIFLSSLLTIGAPKKIITESKSCLALMTRLNHIALQFTPSHAGHFNEKPKSQQIHFTK